MVETTIDGLARFTTDPLKTIVNPAGQQQFNATTQSVDKKQVVNPNKAVMNTPPPGVTSDKFLSTQKQIELLNDYKTKGLDPNQGFQMLLDQGFELEGYSNSLKAWNQAEQDFVSVQNKQKYGLVDRSMNRFGNVLAKAFGKAPMSLEEAESNGLLFTQNLDKPSTVGDFIKKLRKSERAFGTVGPAFKAKPTDAAPITTLKAVGNLFSSEVVNTISGIANAVVDPFQTVEDLAVGLPDVLDSEVRRLNLEAGSLDGLEKTNFVMENLIKFAVENPSVLLFNPKSIQLSKQATKGSASLARVGLADAYIKAERLPEQIMQAIKAPEEIAAAGTRLIESGRAPVTQAIETIGTPIKKIQQRGLPQTPEDLARLITQAPGQDIESAVNVFRKIDPNKIKRYDDLATQVQSNKGNFIKTIDTFLDQDPRKFTADDASLVKTFKVGDTVITENFVKKALDELIDISEGKPGDLAKFTELQRILNTDGLSTKQINQIAREHGSARNSFTETGRLRGTNLAEQSEATRSGVKETLRDLYPEQQRQQLVDLDNEISNHITVENILTKRNGLIDRASKARVKIADKGIVGSVAQGLFDFIDITSFGAARALQNIISKGTAQRSLSLVEIEQKLGPALEKLQRLEKLIESKKTPEKILQEVQDLATAGVKLTKPQKKTLKGVLDELGIDSVDQIDIELADTLIDIVKLKDKAAQQPILDKFTKVIKDSLEKVEPLTPAAGVAAPITTLVEEGQ